VPRNAPIQLLFAASEKDDLDLEPVVHQTVQASGDGTNLSSNHLFSISSAAYEEESDRRRASPSQTRVEKGSFDQQADAEEEEESRSLCSAGANFLDLTDGMMADTSKAELSICSESPAILRSFVTPTVPGQLQANGFGLPGADCSSNSFSSSHEQRKPRHSVSFAQTVKAVDGRRKFAKTEADDGSSSALECKDSHSKVLFLQGEDGLAIDASHAESLTASDPPNLVKSAPSDFEVRPKGVISDLGMSPRNAQHEFIIKTVMFAPISRLSTGFSFWKAQCRRRQSSTILDGPDIVARFRPTVRQVPERRVGRLKELAERYELLAEIDAQREINAKLKERLRQMEREHISTQRFVAVSNGFDRYDDSWSRMNDTAAQRPHLSTNFRNRFT
jgi:hypothetical protein